MFVPLQPLLVLLYLLRWPVTGVFIVNETLNETRRNTQKLLSHHEETVLQSCYTSNRRRLEEGEGGLVGGGGMSGGGAMCRRKCGESVQGEEEGTAA